MLRLVTDGDLSAYTDFATGFHAGDLAWEARKFMATIAPMLMGIDAFDREHIWQKLWYAQRFFYTGRGLVDTIDTMLWDLLSRYARLHIYKSKMGRCRSPTVIVVGWSRSGMNMHGKQWSSCNHDELTRVKTRVKIK